MMTRRVSLALALALTTVVTFAVIATGRGVGLFGGGSAADGSQAVAAETVIPAAESLAAPEITTEYVYVDGQPAPRRQGQGQTQGDAPSAASPEPSSSPDDESDNDDPADESDVDLEDEEDTKDEDEADDEHENEDEEDHPEEEHEEEIEEEELH
jgi:hypothetical protein